MSETGRELLEEASSKLLNQYLNFNPNVTAEIFRGDVLEDLHIF